MGVNVAAYTHHIFLGSDPVGGGGAGAPAPINGGEIWENNVVMLFMGDYSLSVYFWHSEILKNISICQARLILIHVNIV